MSFDFFVRLLKSMHNACAYPDQYAQISHIFVHTPAGMRGGCAFHHFLNTSYRPLLFLGVKFHFPSILIADGSTYITQILLP